MPNYRRKLPRIEWGGRRTLFRYVAGEDLTLLGAVFSRGSEARYTDANGVIQTAASGVARDAHYVNGERTLLLEPDGVNLLVRSQEFDNASWSKVSCSVSANQVLAPDATLTMDLLTAALTTGGVAQSVTFTGNGEKVFSVFLRQGSATVNGLLVYDVTAAVQRHLALVTWTAGIPALSTSAGSGTLFPPVWYYNDGWRVAISATGIVAANSHEVWIYPDRVSGTGTVYAWGAQAENAAVPSSYIPTTSATVTRSRDDLYFPLAAAPQQLTVYVRAVNLGITAVNSAWFYSIADGSGNNPRLIGLTAGAGVPSAYYEHGSFVSSTPIASAPAYGQMFEHRTELYEDGSVVGTLAVNGGAEAVGARTSPASSGLAAAWSGQRVYLGSPAGARGPVAYTHFVVVAGTYGIARLRGVGAGDDIFDAVLSLGYPLDEAVSYPVPQDGGQVVFTPSGEADGWDAGTAHVLEGVVRWIPRETTATPVATGWDGASGWRAFLEWARRGNAFWFCPDASDLSTGWTVHLEAPFDEGPTLEPDMTRALRVRLRATVPIEGY